MLKTWNNTIIVETNLHNSNIPNMQKSTFNSYGVICMIHVSFSSHVKNFTSTLLLYFVQEFKWSEGEKSQILSGFFWGYVLLQIFIGKMAEKYGAKIILAVAMSAASLLNIAIPFFAPYGYLPVLILRVLQGAVQVGVKYKSSEHPNHCQMRVI